MKVVEVIDVDTTRHDITVSCHYGNSLPSLYVTIGYYEGSYWFIDVLNEDLVSFSRQLPPVFHNRLLQSVITEFRLDDWADHHFNHGDSAEAVFYRTRSQDGSLLAKIRREETPAP